MYLYITKYLLNWARRYNYFNICTKQKNSIPANISETITDEVAGGGSGEALAWCLKGGERMEIAAKDMPHAEKLEKFVEDVK